VVAAVIAGARDFLDKVWGLPAYYAGQLLIAWSIS
jgi:hypothetical protein